MAAEDPAAAATPKRAFDAMTAPPVTVTPETLVRDVANLLVEKRISAAPVVDAAGDIIGMVSEGDLLGRSDEDRAAGLDWWLSLLAGAEPPRAALDAAAGDREVRAVMHAPVITIAADAPLRDVAELLRAHRIKRLPVMQEGRMIGIVSRADLLRVVAAMPAAATMAKLGGLAGFLSGLAGGDEHTAAASRPRSDHARPAQEGKMEQPGKLSANAFRGLVEASQKARAQKAERTEAEEDAARQRQAEELMQTHLDAEAWQALMDRARSAAEHGQQEICLLNFPAELCTDGGRKIDVAEAGWPQTLRGEAADLFDRWERELKPAGFALDARVTDYRHGKLGEIGLFLSWRE